MLTLQNNPQNIEIAKLIQGHKKLPVFWHPIIEDSLRNEVTELQGFNTHLRDRFELSTDQANEIFKGLTES